MKNAYIAGGLLVIIAIIGTAFFASDRTSSVKVDPMNMGSYLSNKGGSGTATSSVTYLAPNLATGDYVLAKVLDYAAKDITQANMHLAFNASTTGSRLNWTYFFGEKESDGSVTWYPEDESVETSQILTTHGATKNVHAWTPAVSGANYKNVILPEITSDLLRVEFDVDTASGSLFAEIVIDNK